MLLHHQQHSDTRIFGRKRTRKVLRPMPQSSPLLVISKPQSKCEERTTPQLQCDIDSSKDALEIKELCQSPRSSHSSRCSMFFFSPGPSKSENSPEMQCKQQLDGLKNLSDGHKEYMDFLDHPKELSDDSSLSSPEGTPLASNISPNSSVPTDRRRYMVINELIDTESKYINNLNTILTVFMPALEHVVAPRDLRLLIPAQLEMLVESQQDILKTLKQRMGSETKFYGFIGDIFSRLCNANLEYFNMYRVYMGEFKIAMKTLMTYQKESTQFKEILTLLQQSPLCERLSLASYLLTPIQRLPRYELLLKELMKHTPLDHPDNYFIGEALGRIRKELTKLNLSIKSCQMACPVVSRKSSFVSKGGNIARRRSRRTLSVLKKFVSATNIYDSSSGDSSLTADDLMKPPSLRVPRRVKKSPSFCGSDNDLSDKNNSYSMFRHGTLNGHTYKAVSCSDLLLDFEAEESDEKEEDPKSEFHLLTPLASEACTPNSSRHSSFDSQRNSYFYSSNSSLSSLESQKELRDGSLTPTAAATSHLLHPAFSSTPTDSQPSDHNSKDSTLKVTDEKCVESDSSSRESGSDKSSKEGISVSDNKSESVAKKKSSWRLSLFKKNKKKSGSDTKSSRYIKQQI